MRRYWILFTALCVLFLLLFGIGTAAQVPLLTDPGPLLRSAGAVAGLAGVGLLIADVVLPVPSSLIMLAHGTAFGFWVGALLSLAGSVGCSMVGFALGRGGRGAVRRFVKDDEYERAAGMLDRWGTIALIATRPVPILAETVAILAGASPTGWVRMFAASAVGALAPALLYAWAGSAARRPLDGAAIVLIVVLLSLLAWWIGHAIGDSRAPADAAESPGP